MKITAAALLVVILIGTTLAQMRKIKVNNKSHDKIPDEGVRFDASDDDDMLHEYQRVIIILRNGTINTLKSIGYKLSSIIKTLKASAAARNAIKTCYNNKPKEEFQNCAMQEIENARVELEASTAVDQRNTVTTRTTKTPIISKILDVFASIGDA